MLNKVVLIGNLGQDPEVRYTQDGKPVCSLSLATSMKWKDKDGKQKTQTEWHRVVLWNKTAEIAQQYLYKGGRIYIEGRLQTRQWQDSDGNKRYTTEVIANQMKMLNAKKPGTVANESQGDMLPDEVPF